MSDITASIRALPDPRLRPLPAPVASVASREPRLLGVVTGALPLLGLGVGAWLALRGSAARRPIALGTVGVSLGLAAARWQFARVFAEHGSYEIELSAGNFEVRRYAPSTRAETVVEGLPWNKALSEGFRRIASYVFGEGQAGSGKRIAMTTPVTATIGTTAQANRTVAFTMPSHRSLSTLPMPKDNRVRLRYVPARRVAALRFSGRYGGELPVKKGAELLARVRAAGLHALGEVTFAGYDAPSTLPWFRRNEVLVDLAR